MFVKMSILKRLMKEAYKSGLVLANNGETIMIAGNYWQMDIKRALMPKELLAAIIELAGELPGAGERSAIREETSWNLESRWRSIRKGARRSTS